MPAPPLVVQTTYAELVERCAGAAFTDAFADEGAFISKTIKERRYWYFQTGAGAERMQRYVGPETPELSERIKQHRRARNDERERRALVGTMVRSFGLPRPLPQIGNIIEALAKAGVFRLRGVLVGTAAYQTYLAMLGVKFPSSLLQTADVDIAQFSDVSVAVKDNTPPMLDVLRLVDETFRTVPNVSDGRHATSYASKNVRVDFLTPAKGSDRPQLLPALGTDAQPLPFLDFLIHEPESAVVLHGSGIYVQVPAPQRYAVHKLIVARRRAEGSAKRDKDIRQAEALLQALVNIRPFELKEAWREAYRRGPRWRQFLTEGLSQIDPQVRDRSLKVINELRSLIPELDLTFNNSAARYDFERDVVTFIGGASADVVACGVSGEALDDHFGAHGRSQEARIESFLKNRSKIESMARAKYLLWPIDEPSDVLIKTADVPKLAQKMGAGD